MNKFERQGRPLIDQQTLSESLASEPTVVPADIPDISDAPPIAPPAPLTHRAYQQMGRKHRRSSKKS